MLREIRLANFKCYEALNLNCAPLTLLCGLNGMGKSSVIQALLVLRQSFVTGELKEGRLALNGELVDLGTGRDVLFEDADEDIVKFELHRDEISAPCKLLFVYSKDADQLQAKDALPSEETGLGAETEWSHVPPFSGNVIYIGADRIGPQKIYGLSTTFARLGNLGLRGEYAMNYLNQRQEDILDAIDLRFPEQKKARLLEVVDYWLQEVTPGAHLQFETIPGADALVAGFEFDKPGDIRTNRYRTTNVGFGLSYVLPVLAGLLAPTGALCLIENPEAHLHPRGQTKLAELAVRASLSGIQVIAETHSDHFMDGVRIAVRDGLIRPNETAFHYFARDNDRTVVSSPEVNADGRLSLWPPGFFDQHEENLAKLLAPKS